jgi:hypothetical protein
MTSSAVAPSVRRWLAFALAILAGCQSIRLISPYDETTDKALTALQQSSDDFLTKMIARAPSDDNALSKNTTFYDDVDQQLRRIEFRVGSIPQNDKTVKLVADIRIVILGKNYSSTDATKPPDPAHAASLWEVHRLPENVAKGPSHSSLEVSQRNINQTIGAALALELAKKQGT